MTGRRKETVEVRGQRPRPTPGIRRHGVGSPAASGAPIGTVVSVGVRVLGAISMLALPAVAATQELPDTVLTSEDGVAFRVERLLDEIEGPSAMAFLPDGRLLLAERAAARLSVVELGPSSARSAAVRETVTGLPPIFGVRDAGLHDVIVAPDFSESGRLYLSWTEGDSTANGLVVGRARLRGTELVEVETLFTALPARDTAFHYGGRLLLHDGHLFVTVGDHHYRQLAQDLATHLGKVVRIRTDGGVPHDNPFVGSPAALPEIWTLGHRNAQGMALDPSTGRLWIHEHGPLGGDELNLLRPGANYGWPRITWGREYSGEPVGEGRARAPGLEQPAFVFPAATAPSDMFFYSGDAFPAWKGSLFMGSMGRVRQLQRLVVEDRRVLRRELPLAGVTLRIRSVEEGPDGFIYAAADEGVLFRLRPAAPPS